MGRNSHIPAADTQHFIIEKSSVIFNKKGFFGTSLSDLEKATGLTKGSIYANFKDKEDVSVRVFEYNYQQLKEALSPYPNKEKSIKGKLKACVDFYLDFYPKLLERGGCAIQNSLVESDDTNPALFQKAKEALLSWKHSIIHLVETGIENKEISNTIVASDFATYFIAIIEGSILIAKSLNDRPGFNATLNKLKAEIEGL
ncbi:TetR/AcrR family transcriptional regulator [Desertivirga xinjiangensis]|uniref:TetR/AcrR family transcriptional regulator n=1 Tax=Desertivirga xinjiangensis TaxID=539206 RepID=UPI00210C3664|nr:TetR/AcrR family transcriptional regulator [Pedobacter xinjiangensis]